MFQLSKGSLRKILDGENVSDPILEIMQMKNIQNNMDGMTRYKVSLFDGETQHTFGILATQKNHLVEDNSLKIGSIIRLEEYAANVLSKDPPKVVVILLNFEIIGTADENAKEADYAKPVQNENIEPTKTVQAVKKPMDSKSFFNKKEETEKPKQINANNSSAAIPGHFNGHKICGISSLNPYQNKWSIQVRVTNKSPIRTYHNAKGEGKLFNFDLSDSTSEIRCSGFNESVDKFYDMLNIDSVYFISRASLKTANKQYSRLANDYEMTLGNESVIELCTEQTDACPPIKLDIVKLNELADKNANDFVDVIGVVKNCSDVTTIMTKATQKELTKREITLVDDSNYTISCTLWGKQAEDFDGTDNPVVLLKGAKLGDFNGRNLSVGTGTVFQLNPDIEEAHKLRGWFDNGGNEVETTGLSNQVGGGSAGGGVMTQSNWKTLEHLKSDNLGMGDKPDYFTCKGTILYGKKDNSMYMACPGEGCNKKIIDQNDGSYRCEKCAKSYNEFNWRMILSINLADAYDSTWATCFQETAELILGIKANDLGELKTTGSPKFDEYFSECVFKEFNFSLRCKMETYNDDRRVKVNVAKCDPIEYVSSGRRLLTSIKKFANTQM
jgi:replication factor A1